MASVSPTDQPLERRLKVYSPIQVLSFAFLGGSIAAVYVLKKNYDALGDKVSARKTLIWGIVFNIALFAVIPFLPNKFPNMVLPIGYSVAAREIARTHQMTKEAIAASPIYGFASNWKVLGLGIAFLVGTFVLLMAWVMGLDAARIIHL
jgi:hypothetical protein